jgi:hypothetical protein
MQKGRLAAARMGRISLLSLASFRRCSLFQHRQFGMIPTMHMVFFLKIFFFFKKRVTWKLPGLRHKEQGGTSYDTFLEGLSYGYDCEWKPIVISALPQSVMYYPCKYLGSMWASSFHPMFHAPVPSTYCRALGGRTDMFHKQRAGARNADSIMQAAVSCH